MRVALRSGVIAFLLLAGILVAAAEGLASESAPSFQRPVHTYSIVARDPETGDMGVGVQSHWFAVGRLVAWGEAGVGVVATQSFIDSSYGPLGLALMKAGRSAKQALEALKKADPHPEVRQVAMLDVKGTVAAHTGEKCIPAAGHLQGDNFSVQANLMHDASVWPAMAGAYRSTRGDLAAKILAALEAAQASGGDLRGKQSAAILIVKAQSSGRPWADRAMDLRVDDHPKPVQELKRLVRIHRAYEHMNRGDLALEQGDEEKALQEYRTAGAMVPENPEMKFWHGVSLVNRGHVEASVPLFREIFARDKNWATLFSRLPGVGLLNVDKATLESILALGDRPPAPARRRLSPAPAENSLR